MSKKNAISGRNADSTALLRVQLGFNKCELRDFGAGLGFYVRGLQSRIKQQILGGLVPEVSEGAESVGDDGEGGAKEGGNGAGVGYTVHGSRTVGFGIWE